MKINHESQSVPPQAFHNMIWLWMRVGVPFLVVASCWNASPYSLQADDGKTSQNAEFFEKNIRPVLVKHCLDCHNSKDVAEGKLALDYRDALLKGGKSGKVVVPGKPEQSLLLKAIQHRSGVQKMPQGEEKLPNAIIKDFEKWIRQGAYDPRTKPVGITDSDTNSSWESIRKARRKWWSFQPVKDASLPDVKNESLAKHPIDRFLQAQMELQNVEPAESADKATLLRRATFLLTGLPPSLEEWESFQKDDSPNAYEKVVDRLLQSPRFGERWARHTMDWMRYAETHGSEGDPAIPFAWRYRDYLIRAWNQDVPWDQLIREQLAGDLLPNPRINHELELNESAIGIAQYRFVQHGFAPTDALDEQVRFTDNQIDVIGKAFMGLTISCARCHHHKFDPIGQDDFYAMYGILASCRPATITIDTDKKQQTSRKEMLQIKQQLRKELASLWQNEVELLSELLLTEKKNVWNTAALKATAETNPLHAWHRLHSLSGQDFAKGWQRLQGNVRLSLQRMEARTSLPTSLQWNLSRKDHFQKWHRYGTGLSFDQQFQASRFVVPASGDQVISTILPGGMYTHLLSTKQNGHLSSPRFQFDKRHLYLKVMGDGDARARYVVQNYPRRGTVYPVSSLRGGKWNWIHWDLKYWNGDDGYVEISTGPDQAVEWNAAAQRSWFGVAEMVFLSEDDVNKGLAPKTEVAEYVTPLFFSTSQQSDIGGDRNSSEKLDVPRDRKELAEQYQRVVTQCIEDWKSNSLSNFQANFLNELLQQNLLTSRLKTLTQKSKPQTRTRIEQLLKRYRELENSIPIPTRAPGILEADSFDQPLFVRGDHKQPSDRIPRGFLKVLNDQPYNTKQSGRLELANDIVNSNNPLTSRVIVNRLWHHLFGKGIVSTTDNFGRLGTRPTHPLLLDYLARRMIQDGWSLKSMIRLMVTSQAFQRSSLASPSALKTDPLNSLLSRFPVRRLEAEAIRDAILSVSKSRNDQMYGPPAVGRSNRRSVYVSVIRNRLDPFLNLFDAPEPDTTHGVRPHTNVPSQPLTLMNDPWVIDQSKRWAAQLLKESDKTDEQRIRSMFLSAFGREPDSAEIRQSKEFLHHRERLQTELQKKSVKLLQQEAQLEQARNNILQPVKEQLLKLRGKTRLPKNLPVPMARWSFEENLKDEIGKLHLKSFHGARIENGALVVNGTSYASSPAIEQPLREKTLEVWVQLENLTQRAGGVMSVETLNGVQFDAIVYAEQEPKHWMAGSNSFKRTRPFKGPTEEKAHEEPVQIVITYRANGMIHCYRNGELYGMGYQAGGVLSFKQGGSHVLFGLRHSPPTGGRFLSGKILHAALYDKALSSKEVSHTTAVMSDFIPMSEILNAMANGQKKEFLELSDQLKKLRAERSQFQSVITSQIGAEQSWQHLTHAMFNLKEFLWLK